MKLILQIADNPTRRAVSISQKPCFRLNILRLRILRGACLFAEKKQELPHLSFTIKGR